MDILKRFLVGFLGLIDSAVYMFIEWIYGLLLDIAEAKPFSNDLFAAFADRIYALLGLFMLFKVSFSLIKYIVNPDDFNDKVKGGKKLVMNILVVLVLIVATPIAFEKLTEAQQVILDDHVLEKIILGTGADVLDEDDGIYLVNVGRDVKVAIFSAFYRPDDDGECGKADPKNVKIFVEKCTDFMGADVAQAYAEEYNNGSVKNMIHREVRGESLFMQKKVSGDGDAINYMFIISTIAGGFTAWIFLTFCIDIAIRTVKLGFLQLIAPIPIISYIEPSSSKNGMFNKWLKEVGKTWADLFIRLGAVYFAITLIAALLRSSDPVTNNFLARIFIILGILIFANQIPKLIGDLLGVKIDGNFSLNPLNKLNSSPLASAVVGGAMGFAGGAAANLHAAVRPQLEDIKKNGGMTGGKGLTTMEGWSNIGKNILGVGKQGFKGIPSMIGGAGSSMVRSGRAGADSKTSVFKAAGTGIAASSMARNARDGKFGLKDKVYDRWTNAAGIRKLSGTTSEIEDRMKANQQQIEIYKRDEQSYSQQMAEIRRVNPIEYNQAFEEQVILDSTGDVMRDADGKRMTRRTYSDYDSYFQAAANITEDDLTSLATRIQDERGYARDDEGLARAMQEAKDEIAQSRGLITQRQFDDYESVLKARDKADDEAHQLEKRNKELQGYLDAKSGKPKE